MSYQRFNKGGRVAKSPFLARLIYIYIYINRGFWQTVCKIRLIQKLKNDFFQKTTFFESAIAQKRFIFEHSYVSYGKRQKSCTFIII